MTWWIRSRSNSVAAAHPVKGQVGGRHELHPLLEEFLPGRPPSSSGLPWSAPQRERSDRLAMETASKVAQFMAGHSNAKTTGLYDRRNDDINLSEVERIGI